MTKVLTSKTHLLIHVSGIMTVLPVSMYQSVQAVQPITTNIPVNYQLAQQATNQVEIAMAPVSTGEVSIVMNSDLQGDMKGESSSSQGGEDGQHTMGQETMSSGDDEIRIMP